MSEINVKVANEEECKDNVTWGLVWGIKPFYKLDTKVDAREILGTNQNEPLKLNVQQELTDSDIKKFFEQITKALNNLPAWLITFHDGFQDGNCKYNGYHWHAVVKARLNPKRDSRWGRALQLISTVCGKTFFDQEKANSETALTVHIAKPPREIICERGTYYSELIASNVAKNAARVVDPSEPSLSPEWTKAKLKEDANYHRITNLVKLMQKYNCSEINDLRQKVYNISGDWDTYRQLMCLPSFDTLTKKAMELYRAEELAIPIAERFDTKIAKKRWTAHGTEELMTLTQSLDVFEKWCEHQKIERDDFVDNVFNVLSREIPKKNTLMLEGSPNSGKSYILRSIVPYYKYWGEVHSMAGGYAFVWQSCLDCGLIMLEEPMLDPATVEQAKLVLEGAPTYVRVKCKPDALMRPAPVFITSNSPLWKFCSGSRDALTERMFHYTTKAMPFLKTLKKQLNPVIWAYYYELYLIRKKEVIMRKAEKDEEDFDIAVEEEVLRVEAEYKRKYEEDTMMANLPDPMSEEYHRDKRVKIADSVGGISQPAEDWEIDGGALFLTQKGQYDDAK